MTSLNPLHVVVSFHDSSPMMLSLEIHILSCDLSFPSRRVSLPPNGSQARREKEQVDERWYTSSRIRSIYPIAAFLTGRFEASIKIPQGQGLWPAFWMLPANTSRGFWAATGEIDIMEVSFADLLQDNEAKQ